MFRSSSLVLAAVFSLAVASSPTKSQAAAPSPGTAMRAVFNDAMGCDGTPPLITSDGGGPYVDGVDGVSCYLSASSGDFLLKLEHSRRYFQINLSSPILPGSPLLPGSCWLTPPTTSVLTQGTFINVNKLASISAPGPAGVNLQSKAGDFRFASLYTASYCSSPVYVQPSLSTSLTWQVCSMLADPSPASDIAVLVLSTLSPPAGYYQLPFNLVVSPK